MIWRSLLLPTEALQIPRVSLLIAAGVKVNNLLNIEPLYNCFYAAFTGAA
jgi:hypothetical protein